MKLKIFDVVELNDKNRATILNINNKEYLAEVVNSAGISLGNKVIKENDIMGIGDHGILTVTQDIKETTVEMLKELIDEDSEIVSIYYGSDVTEDDAKEEWLENVIAEIQDVSFNL